MNAYSVIAACAALGQALAQSMTCAPAGQALCGSAEDIAVVNTSQFAKDIESAGPKAYGGDTSGAQALEAIIGAGKLSAACLACQGASIDCSVQQTDCFSICGDAGNCAKSCKTCIIKNCDVQKACGGVPGVSVQMPFACPSSDNKDVFEATPEILNTKFAGECKEMACGNGTNCTSAHGLSGTSRPAGLPAALWGAAAAAMAVTASF